MVNKTSRFYKNPLDGSLAMQIFSGWFILLTQGLITITGSIVRVTSSGLGCITWPECQPGSLVPSQNKDHSPLHQYIEFGNRMITFLVIVAAMFGLINFIKGKRNKEILFYAWLIPISTIVQAVVGGITVLLKLMWWTVSLHMLLSLIMVWISVILLSKVYQVDKGNHHRSTPKELRYLTGLLGIVVLITTVTGMLVTAAGPHAGDKNAKEPVQRLTISIPTLVELHAKFFVLFLGLLIGLIFGLLATKSFWHSTPEVLGLFACLATEGIVGIIQYHLQVPAPLVVLHVTLAVLIVSLTSLLWSKMRHRDYLITTSIFK